MRTSAELALCEIAVHAKNLVSTRKTSSNQPSVDPVGSMQLLEVCAAPSFDVVEAQKVNMGLTTAGPLRRVATIVLENFHLQSLVVHPVFVFPFNPDSVTMPKIESQLQLSYSLWVLLTPAMRCDPMSLLLAKVIGSQPSH